MWAYALLCVLVLIILGGVIVEGVVSNSSSCSSSSSSASCCKKGCRLSWKPCRGVGAIPVGVTPASLAIAQGGRVAYVANSNNYGLTGGHTVSVLDLRQGINIKTISDPSFDEPWRIGLYRANAYVANSAGSTVTIIDTCTNTVTGVIEGFDGPSGFAVARRLGRAYVNNYGAAAGVGSGNGTTLNVVDLSTNEIVAPPITVGLAPAAVAVSPDEEFVYVACYVDGNPGTGLLQAVSTSSNVVVSSVDGFSGPFGLALSQKGRKRAVVANFGSNNFTPVGTTVSIVDLETSGGMQIVATIDVGIQPAGVAIDPCGDCAYVTNYNVLYAGPGFTNLTPGQGTISIIDLCALRLVGPTIPVGQGPNAIALVSRGKTLQAFTTNYLSNSVSQFNLR